MNKTVIELFKKNNWVEQNLMKNFFVKFFLAVLMITVFDEFLISSFLSARGSGGF
jgi:hypothetical protein